MRRLKNVSCQIIQYLFWSEIQILKKAESRNIDCLTEHTCIVLVSIIPFINFPALFRLELNFIGFYGVLLEFEKRMGVNMQEINSKLWIMVELWRGLNRYTAW